MTIPKVSVCARCGGEFQRTQTIGRPRKYCSPDCHHSDRTCLTCEGTFRGPDGQKYCSTSCRHTGMALRNQSDPEAQAARGRIGGKARGAQRQAKPSSYLKDDGEHVHRKVAERVLGRPLWAKEVVHHEDRDKHNNDPANLIVFPSQAWHARHHMRGHCGLATCDCAGIRLKEVMPK